MCSKFRKTQDRQYRTQSHGDFTFDYHDEFESTILSKKQVEYTFADFATAKDFYDRFNLRIHDMFTKLPNMSIVHICKLHLYIFLHAQQNKDSDVIQNGRKLLVANLFKNWDDSANHLVHVDVGEHVIVFRAFAIFIKLGEVDVNKNQLAKMVFDDKKLYNESLGLTDTSSMELHE